MNLFDIRFLEKVTDLLKTEGTCSSAKIMKPSSIQSRGSGPPSNGGTEPAPPSPQQCLVLQPLLSSPWPGDSGPLFDGGWNSGKKSRA